MNKILTVKREYQATIKEKGSSFIAYLFPVKNLDDFRNKLTQIEKEYHDATHHCYAVKLLNDFKYSDDGEPNGTAGIRILNAIEHYNLVNVAIVVVRYFGGIKLGVGPLGKAYYDAADNVINTAEIITKVEYCIYEIIFDFDSSNKIYHILNTVKANILSTDYDDNSIKVKFEITTDNIQMLNKLLSPIEYKIKIMNTNQIIYK